MAAESGGLRWDFVLAHWTQLNVGIRCRARAGMSITWNSYNGARESGPLLAAALGAARATRTAPIIDGADEADRDHEHLLNGGSPASCLTADQPHR
jgi:hypothetical protein